MPMLLENKKGIDEVQATCIYEFCSRKGRAFQVSLEPVEAEELDDALVASPASPV